MNLIEQLGGYLQARALRALPAATYDCGVRFSREELECAMLDHRRQHNIFEAGDKVVYLDDFMPDSVSVVSEVNDRVWLNDNKAACIKEMIKHAEDEEIKAGRRL